MLILASGSPRRRELLQQIAVVHTVLPADIDETRQPNEPAGAYVSRLALAKARAVAARHPGTTVLGADTTVVLDGAILNKPAGPEEAAAMLRALAGREHEVMTGVAVVRDGTEQTTLETTAVRFTAILPDELAAYLATGDSLDKAGAYGIQGYAARWVAEIRGDFFNVVGLPLAATVRLLRAAGELP